MTSIFETVGHCGNRVQFSPFIDNMLFCVAASNCDTPLSSSQSTTGERLHSMNSDAEDVASLCIGEQEKLLSIAGERISAISVSYSNHQSSVPLIARDNSPATFVNPASAARTSTGFLYILDHFIEDIANPLKCFRSFYWPLGALIDATWLNENYLWSVSRDASIQIWNLSSYLPIEDALSDLEPSPDPVKIISNAHGRSINCIDCNLMPSNNPSIVTAAADSTVKLWDAKTATLLKSFNLANGCKVNCSITHTTSNGHFSARDQMLNHHHLHSFTHVYSNDHRHHLYQDEGTHESTDSHVNILPSEANQVQHSSTLLQLLENSQCFHQMDEIQTQSNLFNSSPTATSPPSDSTILSTNDAPIVSLSGYSSSATPVNHNRHHHLHLNNENRLAQSLISSSSRLQSNTQQSSVSNHLGRSYNGTDVTYVAWSPIISSTFASACHDGQVNIWSSQADDRPNLTFNIDSNNLTSCDWNKYNEYLLAVSSTNGTISLWDIRSTNAGPVTVINGHKKPVKQVKFSPHSPYQLASVSADCTTKIWDITSYHHSCIKGDNGKKITNSRNVSNEFMSESLVDTYRHHSDQVCGFDFNPSIKDRVVDCGRDSLVCLYSLVTPSLNRLSLKPTSSNVNLRSNLPRSSPTGVSTPYSLFSTVI